MSPLDVKRVRMPRPSAGGKKIAALCVLAVVLIAVTTATRAAAAPTAILTADSSRNTTLQAGDVQYAIEYHISCPPSMVDDGSLDYFKSHGFTAVHLIVADTGTYQPELNKIKSLGMLPIIDVEGVIWDGGRLQSKPISSFSSYFQALQNAGWEYVASEGGRAGDLDYLQQYFKGYVNYNCDNCGLWKDAYKHPFTVMNSWESYYTEEWPYIQQGATEAASMGKANGILAGVWEYGSDGVDYNPILTNSKTGDSPSYKSMLDWSYANGVGFTHFNVWCGDSQGLSAYKELGFEQIVAGLQASYPPTSSAANPIEKITQLSLIASITNPGVGQQVTFTATLKSGSTALSSKPVTIYHYANGVRYDDVTNKATDANGQVTATASFGYAGSRTYYATFAGDNDYQAATSAVVPVNVGTSGATRLSLTASTTTPAVKQSVTFTAAFVSGPTPVSAKPVTIYHYYNGVRYDDVTNKATDANGQVTATASFASAGQRTYYATFSGDSSYAAATSGVLTINVR